MQAPRRTRQQHDTAIVRARITPMVRHGRDQQQRAQLRGAAEAA